MTKKPGESAGNKGGIYQEVGPRGGKIPNFSTVPDNKPLPPNQGTPGRQLKPLHTVGTNSNKIPRMVFINLNMRNVPKISGG